MLRNLYYSFALLLGIALLNAGCKKNTVATPEDEIALINSSDKPVTVDIYASFEDYAAATGMLERVVIDGNTNTRISRDILKTGNTYYMDWYSDDFFTTNWYNDNFPDEGNRVKYTPTSEEDQYYINRDFKGYHRISFLDGSKTETEWVAVGAYLFSNSSGYTDKWQELTAAERFKSIKVKKDFTADYTYRDSTGAEKSMMLDFMVQYTESGFIEDVPYIEFRSGNASLGNMIGGKLPTGTKPDYKSNATDSVMAFFPDSDYQYLMIKQ